MPVRYRVKYTPDAYKDLEEIFDYIELGSPRYARTMIQTILKGIDSLDMLPHRYSQTRDEGELDRDVRSMPVPPFLIRYTVNDATLAVTIHSVRHGARDRP